MAARNVNLTPHLAEFVDQSVAAGRFQNASEVVREGLRLLQRQQVDDDLKVIALRQAVELGLKDVVAGRTTRLDADGLSDYLGRLGAE